MPIKNPRTVGETPPHLKKPKRTSSVGSKKPRRRRLGRWHHRTRSHWKVLDLWDRRRDVAVVMLASIIHAAAGDKRTGAEVAEERARHACNYADALLAALGPRPELS
jgi:hypothetical protein